MVQGLGFTCSALEDNAKTGQKGIAVYIFLEYPLSFQAAANDVVERSRSINAGLTGHVKIFSQKIHLATHDRRDFPSLPLPSPPFPSYPVLPPPYFTFHIVTGSGQSTVL
jgi:hypothetical protein